MNEQQDDHIPVINCKIKCTTRLKYSLKRGPRSCLPGNTLSYHEGQRRKYMNTTHILKYALTIFSYSLQESRNLLLSRSLPHWVTCSDATLSPTQRSEIIDGKLFFLLCGRLPSTVSFHQNGLSLFFSLHTYTKIYKPVHMYVECICTMY